MEDESSVQLLPGPNPSWFSCVPLVSCRSVDVVISEGMVPHIIEYKSHNL